MRTLRLAFAFVLLDGGLSSAAATLVRPVRTSPLSLHLAAAGAVPLPAVPGAYGAPGAALALPPLLPSLRGALPSAAPLPAPAAEFDAVYDGRPPGGLGEFLPPLEEACAARERLSDARSSLKGLLAERAAIPLATQHGEVNERIRAKREEILSLQALTLDAPEERLLRKAQELIEDPDIRAPLRALLLLSEGVNHLRVALRELGTANALGLADLFLPWWLELPLLTHKSFSKRGAEKALAKARAALQDAFEGLAPGTAQPPLEGGLMPEGRAVQGAEAASGFMKLLSAVLPRASEELLDSDILEEAVESAAPALSVLPVIGWLCNLSGVRRSEAVYSRILALQEIETLLLRSLIERLRAWQPRSSRTA